MTTASSSARASNVALGFYNGVIINGTPGTTYSISSSTDFANTNAWVLQTNLTLPAATQIWDDNSVDVSKPGHATVNYSVQTGP